MAVCHALSHVVSFLVRSPRRSHERFKHSINQPGFNGEVPQVENAKKTEISTLLNTFVSGIPNGERTGKPLGKGCIYRGL